MTSGVKNEFLADPILVGREYELAELQRYLNLAIEGNGNTIFLSGEAGSGKTRITHEFLSNAKKKGIAVLAGWCLHDAAVPYFPFVEAFNVHFTTSEIGEKASLQKNRAVLGLGRTHRISSWDKGLTTLLTGAMPTEKSGKIQTVSPQVWKDQIFVGVAKTLHEISTQTPIVLFLEDIHWADSASLALLHYVARFIKNSKRILVLATYRSEELTTNAEGHWHPLADILRNMTREDLYKEIRLSNLNKKTISRIAENMLGGSLQQQFIEKLVTESKGNPLFIVESLRMLYERGSLVQENNKWRLTVDEIGIPSKVKDIILRRLAILKHSQRRVLDAASVIGEKFDVELLGAVLAQDSLDVLETLNIIAQSTSLVCVEGNSYRFYHTKSREAIYEEIPLPLKRGYHAKVAERLEAADNSDELSLSDLAFHFTLAANREKSLKYSLAAGEDALARYSNSEAIKHFRFVLQTLGKETEESNKRAIALEGLADALHASGLFKEATRTYQNLSGSVESAIIRLRALRKAIISCYWLGDSELALELAAKAEDYKQADNLEYSRLRLYKGYILSQYPEKINEALEYMSASLRVFEEEHSIDDIARGLVEISFTYSFENRLEESLSATLRSIALYAELGNIREKGFAISSLGSILRRCGFYEEALASYAEANEIAEKIGDYNIMAVNYMMSGLCLELIGDYKSAVTQSLKGLEIAEKIDAQRFKCLCCGDLIREYSRLGDIERAEEFNQKLEKLLDDVTTISRNINTVEWVEFSKAILFSSKGQLKEANKILETLKKPDRIKWKRNYAWILEKHGRTEEAKKQLDELKKIHEKMITRFEHSNIQSYLLAPRGVGVGEEFNVRLVIVNIGRASAILKKVEGLIPPNFKVTMESKLIKTHHELDFKDLKMGGIQVETVKLNLKAKNPGIFVLKPRVTYIDDAGEIKISSPRPVTVTIHPRLYAKIGKETISVPILSNRVTTGYNDLDVLLLGGIPSTYAVILIAPRSDERELLIRRFLEVGIRTKEITFYITMDSEIATFLEDKSGSNFYLFIGNPKTGKKEKNASNLVKFKGVENLAEIDISLLKTYRSIDPENNKSKRACIEIISDVLLQHHALTTRKWLKALLSNLKSQGFTSLAVIDPQMHTKEDTRIITNLFDGELEIYEKETAKGFEKILKVRRLVNERYLEDEQSLIKERLLL